MGLRLRWFMFDTTLTLFESVYNMVVILIIGLFLVSVVGFYDSPDQTENLVAQNVLGRVRACVNEDLLDSDLNERCFKGDFSKFGDDFALLVNVDGNEYRLND